MKKKLLNVAHRGYSSKYPENTPRAFEEALKAGADGFECDLRLTADGEVVIFHDDDLMRLCGRSGSIETSTWAQLRDLKIKGEEPIPHLKDVLENFSTTLMNLEIKTSSRDAVVVENVLRILTKTRPTGRILFSSFSRDVIQTLNVMDPKQSLGEVGLLLESSQVSLAPQYLNSFQLATLNLPKEVFSFAGDWARLQIPKIWVWTLDESLDWKKALESNLPIESIITNRPAELAQELKNR